MNRPASVWTAQRGRPAAGPGSAPLPRSWTGSARFPSRWRSGCRSSAAARAGGRRSALTGCAGSRPPACRGRRPDSTAGRSFRAWSAPQPTPSWRCRRRRRSIRHSLLVRLRIVLSGQGPAHPLLGDDQLLPIRLGLVQLGQQTVACSRSTSARCRTASSSASSNPITDGISSPLHDGDDTTLHPCRTTTEFIPDLRKSTDHARKNNSQSHPPGCPRPARRPSPRRSRRRAEGSAWSRTTPASVSRN